MFKNRTALLALLTVLLSFARPSIAADPRVQAMGSAFVSGLPADWKFQPGSWSYMDVVECFTSGSTCYGSNPSSPYGYPSFGSDWNFQLGPNEAVVVFLRTPPEVRYFGFTQYLYSRASSAKPFIFASLSDTLNQMKFSTLGSDGPGRNLFDNYAVLVWTADLNSLATVKAILRQQGIQDREVNFVPMPIGLPLFMGYGAPADTYLMLMRTALPTVQSEFDSYRAENPFNVVKVGPKSDQPVDPAPTIGYAAEATGVLEDNTLASALSSLVADIKSNYSKSFSFTAQRVIYSHRLGWDCFADKAKCPGGDNHDALYSQDLTRNLTVTNLKDVVVVAGVNHQKTGKALYINHAVVDPIKMTGIVSVDDPLLTSQSALFHAGVKLPKDPRVKEYANLYAYAISYNCNGLKYCAQIPPPTPLAPIGLNPGAPFTVWGRFYVEPRTGVRPDLNEIVPHKVLVGKTK